MAMSQSAKAPSRTRKCLAAGIFFGGAAIITDGTGQILFRHVFLQGHSSRQGGRAQEIVAAAVAVAALLQGTAAGLVGLLAQAAEGVIFPQQGDDRFAGAVFGDKGGVLPGDAPFHPEALLLHVSGLALKGTELLEPGLGKAPDVVADGDEFVTPVLDQLTQVLCVAHGIFPPAKFLHSILNTINPPFPFLQGGEKEKNQRQNCVICPAARQPDAAPKTR